MGSSKKDKKRKKSKKSKKSRKHDSSSESSDDWQEAGSTFPSKSEPKTEKYVGIFGHMDEDTNLNEKSFNFANIGQIHNRKDQAENMSKTEQMKRNEKLLEERSINNRMSNKLNEIRNQAESLEKQAAHGLRRTVIQIEKKCTLTEKTGF